MGTTFDWVHYGFGGQKDARRMEGFNISLSLPLRYFHLAASMFTCLCMCVIFVLFLSCAPSRARNNVCVWGVGVRWKGNWWSVGVQYHVRGFVHSRHSLHSHSRASSPLAPKIDV